jgi:hypothetical protein
MGLRVCLDTMVAMNKTISVSVFELPYVQPVVILLPELSN